MTSSTSSSYFSMGLNTYQLSIDDIFVANRKKLIERMPKDNGSSIIFLQGGESITRYDSDHEPIFRQESYFWYITGVKEPDCSVTIETNTGITTLFIPKLPSEYATIMGKIQTPNEWKNHYHVDNVQYNDDIQSFLLQYLTNNNNEVVTENGHDTIMNGSHNNSHDENGTMNGMNGTVSSPQKILYLMYGTNSDSGKDYKLPELIMNDTKLKQYININTLFPILAECRVIKSNAELQLLRYVTEITSFAHTYVMRNFKVGMMEYQGESLFKHYCYYNYGARLVGYTPICGCGPSSAILHYGHAGEPNNKQSTINDICLFDMGAEYYCYGSDITCSFPACGTFTNNNKHKIIYQAVYNAQVAVYNIIKPGVSWIDCHKAAEKEIINALLNAGILINVDNKTIDELVELRLGAIFMPHGLGHFIGIDTHDVGGYLLGHPQRILQPGLKSLRTSRILQTNMLLTVEPGCYFIDHLLDEALQSDTLSKYLVPEKIEEYRGFGGVRLEDVVQVTETGVVNYTLCPRTMNEIESVMAGGKWPPVTDEAPELRRERLLDPTPLPSPPSL